MKNRRLISLSCAVLIAMLFSLSAIAAEKPKAESMSTFLLLLNEDSSFQRSAADNPRAHIEEYSAWARRLATDGVLVEGEKLKESGMVLTGDATREARGAELPGGEPGGLAGYFVVKAHDYKAAVALASTCPHLRYGGSIVVREIEQLH
jgi:hypothetical protein